MSILVRRSILLTDASDPAQLRRASGSDADAIVLRFGRSSADAVREAIAVAGRGAAEVFVTVAGGELRAGLEMAVWPGLRGILLTGIDSAAGITEAARQADTLERERGLTPGSVTFIVMLESARAVWDVRAIVRSHPRVTHVGLDEVTLASSLRFEPDSALDPFVYARGRVIFEAVAAKVAPVGIAYPLSVERSLSPEVHQLATKARNSGMKGVICPHPEWVEPVNRAFTPTAELVAYNKRVREAFAAGVAAGTAAVPLDGRMIDVPVDEWAIVVLATADACAARDAEKRAAREGSA
jgi:citrate lyase subunit beta / citryl-CoA lyase